MSWKEIWETIKGWFGGGSSIPKWDECTKASCWNGANASQRMMNILSPHMSEDKFKSYMEWMKSRGCNTAHVFTSNQKDGENAGYCIYGPSWSWKVNADYCKLMINRIKALRKNKFGIVLWLFADDSGGYNSEAKKNFAQYLSDLKKQGFLDYASTVVVGLELNEYYSASDVAKLVSATHQYYSGKIGTHQTSGQYSFAGLANICFYQVNPGMSVSGIKAEAAKVKAITGMPLNFFEIERSPSREKCEAAMAGGAFGVGNW